MESHYVYHYAMLYQLLLVSHIPTDSEFLQPSVTVVMIMPHSAPQVFMQDQIVVSSKFWGRHVHVNSYTYTPSPVMLCIIT